jgi:hypothetical protein
MHRKVEYTFWFLNDLLIEEPIGVITNLALVIMAFYFSIRLRKNSSPWPSFFFLFLGLAHLAGAMAHGFFYLFGESMHFTGWVLGAIALFFLEWEMIGSSGIQASPLRWLSISKLIIFPLAVLYLRDFNVVNINFALGMIGIILPLQWTEYRRSKSKSSIWFLRALVFLLLPAAASVSRWNPHLYFNSNDLGHALLAIGFWMIFKSLMHARNGAE